MTENHLPEEEHFYSQLTLSASIWAADDPPRFRMIEMFCRNRFSFLTLFLSLAGIAAFGELAAGDSPDVAVSQKGRMFNPLAVDLPKGGALVIVNDDGDLLHHAYIESDEFNFDSGDQKPGSRTRVVFPTAGDFKVLCGIHPKMKLVVHVH